MPTAGTTTVANTNGGPAIDVANSAGVTLDFDSVSSTNSPGAGINWDTNGTSTLTAGGSGSSTVTATAVDEDQTSSSTLTASYSYTTAAIENVYKEFIDINPRDIPVQKAQAIKRGNKIRLNARIGVFLNRERSRRVAQID